MLQISELYIYPVKSLGGISVQQAELTDRGFKYDRRWMLVDEHNQFLTQRSHAIMAMLQTAINNQGIEVYHKQETDERVIIPFETESNEYLKVQVWDDTCDAIAVNSQLDEWFSRMLKMTCRLVYMPEQSQRKVDPKYAIEEKDITSFSDGYPVLLIGQSSLNDLNNRLADSLPINRFRPNVVFTGGAPYEEDEIEKVEINGIIFYGVKLCSRCVLTTINQETMEKGKEPLKTLATYRMQNNKIYFGQNILYNKAGIIHIGDELIIKNKKPTPFA
jgi:uncharacterized protein YcbX